MTHETFYYGPKMWWTVKGIALYVIKESQWNSNNDASKYY